MGLSRPGKKITILGDCYECPADMLNLAQNSDVLIHEATLENSFKEKAVSNGHSTPSIACHVANQVNAKCLILNHFSQRYKPIGYVRDADKTKNQIDDDEEDAFVQKLVDEAKNDFKGSLIASYDLFCYKI